MPSLTLSSLSAITYQGEGIDHTKNHNCDVYKQSLQDSVDHIQHNVNAISTFTDRVAKKGWSLRGDSPENGNCIFWSISDKLIRSGVGVTPSKLRENVVNYINSFPKELSFVFNNFLLCKIIEISIPT